MCGIVGYIGKKDAAEPLFAGLEALHYRGYDSAGVATVLDGSILLAKQPDKNLAALAGELRARAHWGTIGIAHTRWATHGEPSWRNAHPHLSYSGRVAIVHNGMVENVAQLKRLLEKDGIADKLVSETDTEVVAFLIERELDRGARTLAEAVRRALSKVEGAYAIAALARDCPDEIVGAKSGSPLVFATNDEGEWLLGSDTDAFAGQARLVEYLEDGELVTLRRGAGPRIERLKDGRASRESRPQELDTGEALAERGLYAHFMRKELFDLPEAVRNTLRGRLNRGGVKIGAFDDIDTANRMRDARRIVIVACGTSLYAGMVGKLLIERFAGTPVEAADASEWRYGECLVSSADVVIAVSQSGETKDTLEALRKARELGALSFAINNRVGKALAREARRGMYLHAGPEVAVASTKAFAAQVAAFALIAAKLALLKHPKAARVRALLTALDRIPEQLERVLKLEGRIAELARQYQDASCIPIIGRGVSAPVAYEGALKLQEVAYLAGAHGFAGGALKHGPLALIEPGTPLIALMPRDPLREKMLGNVSEAFARGANVIALTNGEDADVRALAPAGRVEIIPLPETAEELSPILTAPALQLFAYHLGVLRGIDVDKPRNLAKSVTVE